MAKIKMTLVKSPIDRPQDQKDTVKALGFRKVYQTIEKEENPALNGMVRKVSHLLKIEKV
jgi:large subunit ribosomal protein L30